MKRVIVIALFCLAPAAAAAQLIPVKTIPVAESEQFSVFPSAGRTTLSMLFVDSLVDAFNNPAKGALMPRSTYFGAPSFFSVTGNAGGGTTLPMGAAWRRGSTFGGLGLAFQEIDRANEGGFFGPVFDIGTGSTVVDGSQGPQTQGNRYAFAMLGRTLDSARLSIAASVLWSNLRSVDGSDQFYDGNSSLAQLGDAIDLRLGVTRQLSGGRTLEAMVLRNRFGMSDEVGFVDFIWDPGTRQTQTRMRKELNAQRTDVWGLHLEYEHPLDSGWRLGALATTNLIRHPRIPLYAVTSGLGSEGRATAYNFGGGIGRTTKLTSVGVDAIYEPISNRSWIRDTVDNRFDFYNAKVRGGVSRDFPMATPGNLVRLQFGADLHWINYRLRQDDHVNDTSRETHEHWLERGRSGGVSFITNGLQLHYLVSAKNGVGRPGVVNDDGGVVFAPEVISVAPWGGGSVAPVGLGSVNVTRHMFSISVPVR